MNNNQELKLSVIIPVLNEAGNLRALLPHLYHNLSHPETTEVLIVDGGSTDSGEKAFEDFKATQPQFKLRWIACPKQGRAPQMNLGARSGCGTTLYFLHADSFPPVGFDAYIEAEIANGNLAGCFRMKFDSSHWWLRLAGWFTRFNWMMCRGGDQSQFISRELFEQVGGFNESYRIFEDNMLISSLYARGQFVVIPKTIITSCRRYTKTGIWKLQFHFWMMYFKHRRGAGPEHLFDYYSKHLAK